MLILLHKFKHLVSTLENKVSHIETNMAAIATTVNNLVDAHDDHDEEQQWIKDKIADIEDRSCHNNLKICGIPESVQAPELSSCAKDLING